MGGSHGPIGGPLAKPTGTTPAASVGLAAVRLQGAGFDYSFRLGSDLPKPTAGGPMWNEETRPEKVALTTFDGYALIRVDVPVLLDGWRTRTSVQPQLDQIRSLIRAPDGQRPPDFIATGPIPYSGLRCVMDPPDEGDLIRANDGTLLRQALILKLIEFQDPDVVVLERRDAGGAGGGGGKLTYTTKAGDTLNSIAVKLYGHFAAYSGTAKEIGNLNGIRDVRKKLKAGLKLRLPRPPGTP